MALLLELLPGEPLTIGDSRITVMEKTGKKVRLRIESREPISHAQNGRLTRLEEPTQTKPEPAGTLPTLRRTPLPR